MRICCGASLTEKWSEKKTVEKNNYHRYLNEYIMCVLDFFFNRAYVLQSFHIMYIHHTHMYKCINILLLEIYYSIKNNVGRAAPIYNNIDIYENGVRVMRGVRNWNVQVSASPVSIHNIQGDSLSMVAPLFP